jgi:hypothetical protein
MQSEIEISNVPINLLSQKILCYRQSDDDCNLLERIMRETKSSDFIAFVWNECDFWHNDFKWHQNRIF